MRVAPAVLAIGLLVVAACGAETIDPEPERPNQPPVANDDQGATAAGKLLVIDVVANDADPDADALTVVSVVPGVSGTVQIGDAHRVSFLPSPSFEGEATFEYSIDDGHGGQASATVTIDVREPNRPPLAIDDRQNTQQDDSVSVDVLANDSDPDRDPLTVESVTEPAAGTVSIEGSGRLRYQPAPGYTGVDRFGYVVTDGRQGRAAAEVAIRVNGAPVANDDRGVVFRRSAVEIDVLANDVDGDGDAMFLTSVTMPAAGTATITADNRVRYTPGLQFSRSDAFAYQVSDLYGGTATASVAISTGTAPVARDDAASTQQGWAIDVMVLANDSDADGDPLTIVAVNQPASGTATIASAGVLRFTPAPGFYGEARVRYTISDGTGGTDSAELVVGVNGTPVAVEDRAVTLVRRSLVIDILANDSDPDGDPIQLVSVGQPAQGTTTRNPDDTVRFNPAASFRGVVRFRYTIADGRGGTAQGQAHVWVNAPPVAVDDDVLVQQATDHDIDVLGNDTDEENNPLTVTAVTQGRDGQVTVNGDNTVRYAPLPDFFGVDTFSYTASDGLGGSDQGTVSVSVNGRPIARDDAAQTIETTPVVIDLLANDEDPDGDTIAVTSVGAVNEGLLVDNGNGTQSYTAAVGFFGEVTFSYEITDARGGADTAAVTITVNGGLFGRADSALTQQGVPVDIEVLANDSDPDNDPLQVVSVTQGASGAVSINMDDSVRYAPVPSFFGVDTFTYVVGDGRGSTATASVSVTVNAPPTAANDDVIAQVDTDLDIDVLANDSDPDNGALTIVALGTPTSGTATVTAQGLVRYTPASGLAGAASFTYTIADGAGGQATGTVSVDVNGQPNAVDDNALTQRGEGLDIDVLANDDDPEMDTLSVDAAADGANGTVTVNGDGTVRYTPSGVFFGNDAFTYTLIDGRGGSDVGTVTVAVNAPPMVTADEAVVLQDRALDIRVLDNDVDPDGDTLQFAAVTRGTNGAVQVNVDRTLRYTPDAGYVGSDEFTYRLQDGRGGASTATVTVTVVRRAAFDSTTTARTGIGDAWGLAMGNIDDVLRQDVVVTNRAAGTVTVLVGRTGFGGVEPVFGDRVEVAVGAGPVAAAVGDIDGDGAEDVVTANQDAGSISVLRNLTTAGGAPTFAAQVEVAAGALPGAVLLTDVNGDGRLDVVVSNRAAATLSVLMNTTAPGTGVITLVAALPFATGAGPAGLAARDFDGDGVVDLVVANSADGDVSLLLNQTVAQSDVAAFSPAIDFTVGNGPAQVAIGDVDGDGSVDIVVSDNADDNVAVLRRSNGDGDLGFAAAVFVDVGDAPVGLVLADLDGDGRPNDLAVADSGSDTISLLRNTSTIGNVAFAARQTTPGGPSPALIVASQLNAAGLIDVLVNNPETEAVTGRINQTAGAGQVLAFPTGGSAVVGRSTPVDVVVADFTTDGRLDVAVLDQADATVSLFANTTTVSTRPIVFAAHETFAAGARPSALSAADIDGDGLVDLVVVGGAAGEIRVLRNATAAMGTDADFDAAVVLAVGTTPQRALPLDVNADGRVDLVVSLRGDDAVAVLINASTPQNVSFGAPVTFGAGLSPSGVSVADMNGDGAGDVCVANADQLSVSVLFNETVMMAAVPVLSAEIAFTVGTRPEALVALDVNGDGRTDLITANEVGGSLSVLRSTTEALAAVPTFAPAVTFNQLPGNDGFGQMATADMNGDGRVDVLVPTTQDGSVQIVYNLTVGNAETAVLAAVAHASGTQPSAAAVADLNGDGRLEVIVVNAESDDLVVLSGP